MKKVGCCHVQYSISRMALTSKVLSDFLILPHHCTKNHELLIYRLDIFNRKKYFSCYFSCTFWKFLGQVVSSYKFLRKWLFLM